MNRLPLSAAGAALLRALLKRAGTSRDRILLTEIQSTEWQSLTFVGERHRMQLKISGADAAAAVQRLRDGLEDAEFALPGHIVADIALTGQSTTAPDGTTTIDLEALTIVE